MNACMNYVWVKGFVRRWLIVVVGGTLAAGTSAVEINKSTGAAGATLPYKPLHKVVSPDKNHTVVLGLSSDGVLHGRISRNERIIVEDVSFGNVFRDGGALRAGLRIDSARTDTTDESYTGPAGKNKHIRNHYNQITVNLSETDGLKRGFVIELRVYDDGVAFRYLFPEQPGLKEFVLTEELTTFVFPGNHDCWASVWRHFNNHNEAEYPKSTLNDLNPEGYIQRPITIQRPDGIALCLYEANLFDYAGLFFRKVSGKDNTLQTLLAPRLGKGQTGAVKASTPHRSPWRVIQIAEEAAGLIESDLVLNLSDACKIKDTSWIVPGKSMFPWWPAFSTDVPGVPSHNCFENQKVYIDFASENGIEYLELEPPWYHSTSRGDNRQSPANSDPLKPREEMRVQELIRYASSKKVGVFLWIHWSLLWNNPDEIMKTYKSWGAVGMKVDFFERNDQDMVKIYETLVEKAAQHELMVFFHGSYTPTGLRRTWPNFITSEGVLGNEYNRKTFRVTPDHTVTIPFTRMIPGPMDYTPGGFRNVVPPKRFGKNIQKPMVRGTRSRELAMFVVYESPLQMVCDYPGAYRGQPGFDFIKEVPTRWDQTRGLAGAIGDYIVIARRSGDRWFVGAMTDDTPRVLDISLDFLKDNTPYRIESWSDAASGAPATELVRADSRCIGGADNKISLRMGRAGGAVLILTPEK